MFATCWTFTINNRVEFYYGSKDKVNEVFLKDPLANCIYFRDTYDEVLKAIQSEKNTIGEGYMYFINVDTGETEEFKMVTMEDIYKENKKLYKKLVTMGY